eukprot:scaffold1955_cov122-Skeletonema_marinoi.AAC.16
MFWSLASLSPPPPPRRRIRSDASDSALDKARRAEMKVVMKYLFIYVLFSTDGFRFEKMILGQSKENN